MYPEPQAPPTVHGAAVVVVVVAAVVVAAVVVAAVVVAAVVPPVVVKLPAGTGAVAVCPVLDVIVT